MRHRYFSPPEFKMKEYIKFLEWQETRDELKDKKRKDAEDKKKHDTKKPEALIKLGFLEGCILAYLAYPLVGALHSYLGKALN